MDDKILEHVKELRDKGLKRKEIAKQLGVSLATVARAIAKLKKMTAEVVAADQLTEERIRQIIREELDKQKNMTLPTVLKNGKGETLSPEAVYHQIVANDGINGEREFRALMKWAAAIEMVQRMTEIRKAEAEALAQMAKPVLDMMEKSREELDAAVQRAKESSMAIAEAAAAGAAARAAMHIDQRFNEFKQQKPDIATVQDPMKGLMARTMEMMMSRLQAMLFGGGQQLDLGPGFVDKRQGGK